MIIVFGSLNIDLVMPVHHFPAPGETVLCATDYLSRPGGKGANQAVAAARAGAKVAMVGKVGDDSFGRRCVSNLKNSGIWASGIGVSERPTGCATIAVDGQGENIVMVASGANMEATADQVPDEILIPKNTVLTQLEVTPTETFWVITRAHDRGCHTILNAAPIAHFDIAVLEHVHYLIVNEVEAHQLAVIAGIDPKQDSRIIAEKVAAKSGQAVIVTMGEKGAIAAKHGVVYKVSSLPIEVVDTTGAGDAFCGIFAACLDAGDDWLVALHHAAVGSSLSCLGLGAQAGIPYMEEIKANLVKVAPPARI